LGSTEEVGEEHSVLDCWRACMQIWVFC